MKNNWENLKQIEGILTPYQSGSVIAKKGARILNSHSLYLDFSLDHHQLGLENPVLDAQITDTAPSSSFIVTNNDFKPKTELPKFLLQTLDDVKKIQLMNDEQLKNIFVIEDHPFVLSKSVFLSLEIASKLGGFLIKTPWGFRISSESDPTCSKDIFNNGNKILNYLLHPLLSEKIDLWIQKMQKIGGIGLVTTLSKAKLEMLHRAGIVCSEKNESLILNPPLYMLPEDFEHLLATLQNLREN